jgi:hypothetical protein
MASTLRLSLFVHPEPNFSVKMMKRWVERRRGGGNQEGARGKSSGVEQEDQSRLLAS